MEKSKYSGTHIKKWVIEYLGNEPKDSPRDFSGKQFKVTPYDPSVKFVQPEKPDEEWPSDLVWPGWKWIVSMEVDNWLPEYHEPVTAKYEGGYILVFSDMDFILFIIPFDFWIPNEYYLDMEQADIYWTNEMYSYSRKPLTNPKKAWNWLKWKIRHHFLKSILGPLKHANPD